MINNIVKLSTFSFAISLSVAVNATDGDAHELHEHAHFHSEKGINASELFPGYASLCDLSMIYKDVNVPRTKEPSSKSSVTNGQKEKESPRSKRVSNPVEAMQVFDNFYFVGTESVSAWLLGTPEGYILIDTLTTDEEAETVIMGGIKKLGINPANIKHIILTHAHGDHYGGHRYISKVLDLPVTMSEADWTLSSTLGVHPRFGPAPVTGNVVKHDDKLVAGTTQIDIHITPSHTMGTISPIFTVYDNGVPYRAALWGGTGFNFGVKPDQFAAYAESAYRFKENAEKEKVEVFFSNHGKRDGSIEKMQKLATRKADEPHPFVMGERALDVYEVLGQCAMAQYDRIVSGQYEKELKLKTK